MTVKNLENFKRDNQTIMYLRVSTDMQDTKNQYALAERYGYTIDKVFSDEDVSGAIPFQKRAGFKQLIEYLQAGDTLVVSEVSRFARSLFELYKIVEFLKPFNIKFIIFSYGAHCNIDLYSPEGQQKLLIDGFVAENERINIMRRTRQAMDRMLNDNPFIFSSKIEGEALVELYQDYKNGMSHLNMTIKYNVGDSTLHGYKRKFKRIEKEYETEDLTEMIREWNAKKENHYQDKTTKRLKIDNKFIYHGRQTVKG